jgi:hypothetical protein
MLIVLIVVLDVVLLAATILSAYRRSPARLRRRADFPHAL